MTPITKLFFASDLWQEAGNGDGKLNDTNKVWHLKSDLDFFLSHWSAFAKWLSVLKDTGIQHLRRATPIQPMHHEFPLPSERGQVTP